MKIDKIIANGSVTRRVRKRDEEGKKRGKVKSKSVSGEMMERKKRQ